ncbi:MAG: hypothetical protein EOP54_10255 [Sphingobacteriales bacterium]|nr:MAG: hypothetical protein EOP54_10255 [Sphingobacteriales bacterium]
MKIRFMPGSFKDIILSKKYFLLVLVCNIFYCFQAAAQQQSTTKVVTSTFAWTPSRQHTVVKGLALGLNAKPWNDSIAININGMNLELGPMGLILGLWGTAYGLIGHNNDATGERISFFSKYGYGSLTTVPQYATYIKGLSISVFGLIETYNKGVFINGLAGDSYTMEGIQVSGLINHTTELTGASIALLTNNATKVNGVQIGLINKCKSGNVVQIGLFNRIGKRVTPFINLNITKRTKQPI